MSKYHVEKLKGRPLSWSSLSAWEWDKKQWAKKYLEGIEEPPSEELIFGKLLAESIENGTCKVPGLLESLEKKKEHKFLARLGDIELIGFADAFCDKTFKVLHEVKSGKVAFDQKRVDSMGQITQYLLMNYLQNKIDPSLVDVTVFWVPTEKIEKDNGDFSGSDYNIKFIEPIEVKKFKTKRTLKDILLFASYIKKNYRDMLDYAEKYEKARI